MPASIPAVPIIIGIHDMPAPLSPLNSHDGAPDERACGDERPEAGRARLNIQAIGESCEHQQGDAQRAGRQHSQAVAR